MEQETKTTLIRVPAPVWKKFKKSVATENEINNVSNGLNDTIIRLVEEYNGKWEGK